jgi:tetratricopeptide (TPR) repeat protein
MLETATIITLLAAGKAAFTNWVAEEGFDLAKDKASGLASEKSKEFAKKLFSEFRENARLHLPEADKSLPQAIRLAYLQATLQVWALRGWQIGAPVTPYPQDLAEKLLRTKIRYEAPLGVMGLGEAQWLDRLQGWLRAEVGKAKEGKLPPLELHDQDFAHLAQLEYDSHAQSLRERTTQHLIEELETAVPEMPEGFRLLLTDGWLQLDVHDQTQRQTWFDFFCVCFQQRLSKDPQAREFFQTKLLANLSLNFEQFAASLRRLNEQFAAPDVIAYFDDLSLQLKDSFAAVHARFDQLERILDQAGARTSEPLLPNCPSPEAMRLLESLPTDRVPEHSFLPPGSVMPFRRNKHHVGRGEELLFLAKELKASGGDAVIPTVVVTGIPGVGKTQLAVEFVHRYGQYFQGGVFWLNFEKADQIQRQVIACGGPGGLDLFWEASQHTAQEKERLVSKAWNSPTPRLLVFDNCVDDKLLKTWLPTSGGCRVLVTSRPGEAAWSQFKARPLRCFERDDGVQLLRGQSPNLPGGEPEVTKALEEIVIELGGLPLALHLAGCYLNLMQISPAEYLAQLRECSPLDHESLQSGDSPSPTGHDDHVAGAFELSYKLLNPDDPSDALALTVLQRAAHFAPGEPIPIKLLHETMARTAPTGKDSRLPKAIRRLVSVGLIEEQGSRRDTLVLHRLLCGYIRKRAGNEANQNAADAVEQVVFRTIIFPAKFGLANSLVSIQAHLNAVVERTANRFVTEGEFDKAAIGHLTLTPYLLKWKMYDSVVKTHEPLKGKLQDPNTKIHSLANLGAAYAGLGDRQKAEENFQQALQTAEEQGEPHDIAGVYAHLGGYFYDIGKIDEATDYYTRAIGLLHGASAATVQLKAKCQSRLALCYFESGRTDQAIEQNEFALKTACEMKDQDFTKELEASQAFNRALYQLSQGLAESAAAEFERVLAAAEAAGNTHAELLCQVNLGDAYFILGRYDAARVVLEKALAVSRTCEDAEMQGHALHQLSNLSSDENQPNRTLELAGEALKVGSLLDDHQIISKANAAMALAYLHLNEPQAAYDSALASYKQSVLLEQPNALFLAGLGLLQMAGAGAGEMFEAAVQQADWLINLDARNYQALYTKCLALCGMALSGLPDAAVSAAEAHDQARAANPHAGARNRIDKLFAILLPMDTSDLLRPVRDKLASQ